ncbi:MAG: hypothetical protein JWM19_5715 [Actinomycetia bacterium]|nr:hypothetical protein [Actinomycetes bacterium]
MKFCTTCNQDRTGDKFCTVCGTEFGAASNTETFTMQKARTEPPRPATEIVTPQPPHGQPPAGQAYVETQFSGVPAWVPTDPGQPSWGQQGGSQQGADQPPTQTYYPGPGAAAQPQSAPGGYPPGQYTPPGQYPAPAQYTPPGEYPPPGQYPAPGAGGQRPGSGRRRTAVLASVAAAVVLAAGAGAFALVSSLHHGTSTTPPAGPAALGKTTSLATTPSTTPAQTTPAATTPATTASPGSSGPASTVTLSQAAKTSPTATQVQTLFNRYFNAINTRNYSEYTGTLDATMQANSTQQHFDSGYASTKDSNEVINSITSNGDGSLTANVSFSSTQAPSNSVDNSSCNKWTLSLPLVPQGSGYVLSTPPSGYATYTDC